jgi:hypothetical protein
VQRPADDEGDLPRGRQLVPSLGSLDPTEHNVALAEGQVGGCAGCGSDVGPAGIQLT